MTTTIRVLRFQLAFAFVIVDIATKKLFIGACSGAVFEFLQTKCMIWDIIHFPSSYILNNLYYLVPFNSFLWSPNWVDRYYDPLNMIQMALIGYLIGVVVERQNNNVSA